MLFILSRLPVQSTILMLIVVHLNMCVHTAVLYRLPRTSTVASRESTPRTIQMHIGRISIFDRYT